MKMKELCAEERPREKMLLRGAASLGNAELLAILIGSGTGGMNAVEVAQLLLAEAEGSLATLASMPVDRIIRQKGIGRTKALSIAASMELGRRFLSEASSVQKEVLSQPDQVFRMMLPLLKGLDHEESWVLYLNRARYLVGTEKLTSGTADSTAFDPKYILKRVFERQASAIILVHNHPSGNPMPGETDRRETRRLQLALRPFDIPLLDHIIVSDGAFFSFIEDRVIQADISMETVRR